MRTSVARAGFVLILALACASPPNAEPGFRSGWAPPWPSLRGPYLGQAVPGVTPEIFAEGIIALGNHEHHLTVSPDGREMVWVIADKYRTRHTLVRVVERDGVWLPPEVAPFSGRDNDFAPSFHPDGSTLFFCSNRPLPGADEPSPDANIWMVARTDDGWGEPRPLPAPVNDGTSEYNPSIAADGTLIFQDHDEKGAVGPNAFKAFRVEIDYASSTVRFEKDPGPVARDMDLVGLTLRPEPDGGYSVLGVARKDGTSAVPGVEPGDRLLPVDDLNTMGATMGTVVDALRGDPGEVRILVLERGGLRRTVEARVERFLERAPLAARTPLR